MCDGDDGDRPSVVCDNDDDAVPCPPTHPRLWSRGWESGGEVLEVFQRIPSTKGIVMGSGVVGRVGGHQS